MVTWKRYSLGDKTTLGRPHVLDSVVYRYFWNNKDVCKGAFFQGGGVRSFMQWGNNKYSSTIALAEVRTLFWPKQNPKLHLKQKLNQGW